jgi:hypothetical protein
VQGIKTLIGIFVLLGIAALVASMGPWYGTREATVFMSLVKLGGLVIAAIAGFIVASRHDPADRQKPTWVIMAVGFMLYACGQSVLAYHQVILQIKLPFPSFGDPFFVMSELLLIWALFGFCSIFRKSGLPLGSAGAFWSPVLVAVVLFVALIPPLIAPVAVSDNPPTEVFLNIFYPVAGFVFLAPSAVSLRVGFKFSGGRLLLVWVPLSLGFAAIGISDSLFSYLTGLEVQWVEPYMDLLYTLAYLLIPSGVLAQLSLLPAVHPGLSADPQRSTCSAQSAACAQKRHRAKAALIQNFNSFFLVERSTSFSFEFLLPKMRTRTHRLCSALEEDVRDQRNFVRR